MAQPNEPKMEVTVLFKFIKPFDGSREKVTSFISNCQNAMDLANIADRPILFKFIQSHLEGKAESACAIKEFESWEQLRDFLKTQFGDKKHYTHLLTDLQECRQYKNESVSQFSLRIESCLSKLLTEITLSSNPKMKKAELAGKTGCMEDLALHTFLMGMTPNVSNVVRSKDPSNLNEAINYAISEEKIQNLQSKRNAPNTYSQPSTSRQQQPSRPRSTNEYSFKPHIHNVNPGNQSDQIICRYCKNIGHTLFECRKREYNNNRFRTQQNPAPLGVPAIMPKPNNNQRFSRPQNQIHHVAQSSYNTNQYTDNSYTNDYYHESPPHQPIVFEASPTDHEDHLNA